jgi:DNA-binding helix-hairpin-helix protein with protein kinase domain
VGLRPRRPRRPALGEGGQGLVFALDDDPELVLKVFRKPGGELSARMRALDRQAPRLAAPGSRSPVAWPAELVLNADGEVGGYLMRRYGRPEYHRLETLFTPVTRAEAFPQADWRFLAGVARNLASVVAGLHKDPAMFVVGDLSPANIVISDKGYVALLDSDSMQFRDLRTREVFPCAALTPNYAPPELQVQASDFPRSPYTDNFSLAVIIVQLLLCGEHPFAFQPADGSEAQPADNIREARSHLIGDGLVRLPRRALTADVLPPEVRAMALSALRDGRLDPRQRPSAQQWATALAAVIAEAGKCRAGHAFLTAHGECPWCERLALGLPDPFGRRLPPDYEPSARVRDAMAGHARAAQDVAARAAAARAAAPAGVPAQAMPPGFVPPGAPFPGAQPPGGVPAVSPGGAVARRGRVPPAVLAVGVALIVLVIVFAIIGS